MEFFKFEERGIQAWLLEGRIELGQKFVGTVHTNFMCNGLSPDEGIVRSGEFSVYGCIERSLLKIFFLNGRSREVHSPIVDLTIK